MPRDSQIHSAAAGQGTGDRLPRSIMLLVPIAQVENLVGERVGMRQTAARRVSPNPGAARRPPPACCWRFRSRPPASSSNSRRPGAKRSAPRWSGTCSTCCRTRSRWTPARSLTTRAVGLYETPVYTAHVQIIGRIPQSRLRAPAAGEGGPRSEVERGAAAGPQLRIARAARGRRPGGGR